MSHMNDSVWDDPRSDQVPRLRQTTISRRAGGEVARHAETVTAIVISATSRQELRPGAAAASGNPGPRPQPGLRPKQGLSISRGGPTPHVRHPRAVRARAHPITGFTRARRDLHCQHRNRAAINALDRKGHLIVALPSSDDVQQG